MNSIAIKFRAYGRHLGLHHVAYRVQKLLGRRKHYEQRFNNALRETIRPGDVVWDVGANVGVYTVLFCNWVGSTGHVVAFEPNPASLAQIQRRLPEAGSTLMNIALGATDGTVQFVADASFSVRSHIHSGSEALSPNETVAQVKMSTGDNVCALLGRVPHVIKIDVEGFEDDVLLGLQNTLQSPSLRAILLEIHFQALQNRGRLTAPVQIEKLLRANGFKLKWVDPNHLKAYR